MLHTILFVFLPFTVYGLLSDHWELLQERRPRRRRENRTLPVVFETVESCGEVPVERNVHVLGLQNTGTDLLEGMLADNFKGRLRRYQFKHEANATTNETKFTRCGNHIGHGIWKHSNLADKFAEDPERFSDLRQQRVVALIMIRSPLAWFQSIRKAPYEFKACTTGDDWLTKACSHPHPTGFDGNMTKKTYGNIVDVWNQWNKAFDLATTAFDEAVVIRYEDLVMEPEHTMSLLTEYLGLKKPEGNWKRVVRSAKMHGTSHGRDAAVEIIKGQSFMGAYTKAQVKQVCTLLDSQLLERYSYAQQCTDDYVQKAADSEETTQDYVSIDNAARELELES